jgi:RimJ/RimL family protein N-acetyltransferase
VVNITEIQTKRLKLRQWQPRDYEPFAQLNNDPEVMAYYPSTLNEKESTAFAQKLALLISKRGWGFWAVELVSDKNFIGFAGLHEPEASLPFTPCTEIGWRLSKQYWGNGYATEAARAALQFAFDTLMLEEIVAFTSPLNVKSKAVMERLNMVNAAKNFNHPTIPEGHKLREQVLYNITRTQWTEKKVDRDIKYTYT